MECIHVRHVVHEEVAHGCRGRGDADERMEGGDGLGQLGRADLAGHGVSRGATQRGRADELHVHWGGDIHGTEGGEEAAANTSHGEDRSHARCGLPQAPKWRDVCASAHAGMAWWRYASAWQWRHPFDMGFRKRR